MAMTAIEVMRPKPENVGTRLQKATKPLRPVGDRLSGWKEGRTGQDRVGRLFIAAKPRFLNSIDVEEAIGITEEHISFPLNRDETRSAIEEGKKRRITQTSFSADGTSKKIEVATVNGVEAAHKPFDYRLDPKELAQTGIWIGTDEFLSAFYRNEPGSYRSYTSCYIGEESFDLWDKQGRAIFPKDIFGDLLAKLSPGETLTFTNEQRNGYRVVPPMEVTVLPLRGDVLMPRFALGVDEDRAENPKAMVNEAREKDLALLWLTKSSHTGLMKAVFWQNNQNGYRVCFRDERGRLFDINDRLILNQQFIPKDTPPGIVPVIIEDHAGDLEEGYKKLMKAIKGRDGNAYPYSVDPHIDRILTVGIGDITQTGESFRKAHVKPIVEITQCPPVLVTFRELPSRNGFSRNGLIFREARELMKVFSGFSLFQR